MIKGTPKKEREALVAKSQQFSKEAYESKESQRLSHAQSLKTAALIGKFKDLREQRLAQQSPATTRAVEHAKAAATAAGPSLREQAAAHRQMPLVVGGKGSSGEQRTAEAKAIRSARMVKEIPGRISGQYELHEQGSGKVKVLGEKVNAIIGKRGYVETRTKTGEKVHVEMQFTGAGKVWEHTPYHSANERRLGSRR